LPFLGQQKFGLNIIAQSWRPPLEKAFKRKLKTQGFILLNNGKQATYVSINNGAHLGGFCELKLSLRI
jgi:hypothetical protein